MCDCRVSPQLFFFSFLLTFDKLFTGKESARKKPNSVGVPYILFPDIQAKSIAYKKQYKISCCWQNLKKFIQPIQKNFNTFTKKRKFYTSKQFKLTIHK